MIGFLTIVGLLVLADLLAWWLATRWLRRYAPGRPIFWACQAFFALQTAYSLSLLTLALLGPTSMRSSMNWFAAPIQAAMYIWHLIFLPAALIIWLIVGSILSGSRLIRLLTRSRRPPQPLAAPVPTATGLSRRTLLLAGVAAVPPLLSLGATGYGLTQTWNFRVRRQQLLLPDLPAALVGLRIALVSDLHVGRWSTQRFLDDVIARTNALKADLILFTGDLIDISISDLPAAIDVIKQLHSPLGVYLVEGNHDLIDDPIRFHSTVLASGVRLLRNSSAMLEVGNSVLQILGIPWNRSETAIRADVRYVASLRHPRAYPILMAHHPHAFDAAAEVGLPLTLSGHTHGGQIALSREINAGSAMFRYISGIYRKGESQLLVSNGTGNWFPLRLGAPAEIIELILARDGSGPPAAAI